MTIQYASDLHLEFEENRKFLEAHPIKKSGDILILAGDILYLSNDYFDLEIIEKWSKMYDRVYMIPGNHEFYSYSFPIANTFPSFKIAIRENVFIVNNYTEVIEDFHLIFSTLYTRLDSIKSKIIRRSLADFTLSEFTKDSRNFTVDDYQLCHTKSKAFIELELEELRDKQAALITHHVPYPSKKIPNYPFDHDAIFNSAFHADLSYWMERYNIRYCLSGHTHFNHDPIKIHNTLCLTNQLGYVARNEHLDFRRDASFSLSN